MTWQFLNMLIAAVALLFSVGPKVRTWFKAKRLEVGFHQRINIGHRVGNPWIGVHVSIKNTGGREVKIKKMSAVVSRDGTLVCTLPGSAFFENSGDQASSLLLAFKLKPGDEWAHTVTFASEATRTREERYRNALHPLVESITALKVSGDGRPDRIVRAPESFAEPFEELFAEQFVWERGEYSLDIRLETEPQLAPIDNLRFTLFDSDSEYFKAQVKEYDTGAGIYWDSLTSGYLSIPLS
ncbi:hypothetical protein [Dokdonella soli]|uniref:Uncharacterized protein n=1 Tax=Dokdonella soli TaxID=529810 RepID=A0ABN1IJ77_9GAMM